MVNGTGNCRVKYGLVEDAIIIPNGGSHEENVGACVLIYPITVKALYHMQGCTDYSNIQNDVCR